MRPISPESEAPRERAFRRLLEAEAAIETLETLAPWQEREALDDDYEISLLGRPAKR